MPQWMPADLPTVVLGMGLLAAVAVAVALGWCCYRLLVERGRLLLGMEEAGGGTARSSPRGLRPGSFLSDFALPRRDEGVATLSGLLDQPLLLVFVRGDCLFSRALVRELAGLDRRGAVPLPVVIVVGESDDPESVALASRSPGPVLLDGEGQVARLMRVSVTPSGYRVDQGRQTVGPLLAGPAALLAAARGESGEASIQHPLAFTPLPKRDAAASAPLGPGDAAPGFTLPTTEGVDWPLDAHLGQPVGLVFADPWCPPCRALLAELSHRDAAGLVVVSRGGADANRRLKASLGPAVTVVVQQNREVARAFRTLETPAAYRIDERGAIAAGPAIGTEEVLALIDRNGSYAAMDDTRAAGALAYGIGHHGGR